MRRPLALRRLATVAAASALAVAVVACSGDDGDDAGGTTAPPAATEATILISMPSMLEVGGAQFVATTTWSGAFVRAAGIDDVAVIAPAGTTDPFAYDPSPEDLAVVADSTFVVLDGREAMADAVTAALAESGEIISFSLDNSPDSVRLWLAGLAERFDTADETQAWIADFDEALRTFDAELDEHRPTPRPTAVVDESLTPWATLAGVDVVGTFDGAALTAAGAGELAALDPQLALVAPEASLPADVELGDAVVVELTNFPDESLDLLALFERNVDALATAFDRL